MMRYILMITAIILAACTFPPIGGNKPDAMAVPTEALPVSPPIEITAPRVEEEPVRHRKASPKPKPTELKNPLVECSDVDHLDDPKEAARARLNCMSDYLDGKK